MLPDGTWDDMRMAAYLALNPSVVVSGAVENQGRFYDRFEAVVLLGTPVKVLIEGVSIRTDHPHGKAEAEQAVIRQRVLGVEPLLRRGATLEFYGRRPLSDLADAVERPMASSGRVRSAIGSRTA